MKNFTLLWLLVGGVVWVTLASQLFTSSAQSSIDDMSWERNDATITSTIRTVFSATDEKNWSLVQDQFDDQVMVDYSSLNWSPKSTLSSTQVVSARQWLLDWYDRTIHQVTEPSISYEGSTASATNRWVALHVYETPQWTRYRAVWWQYNYELIETNNWPKIQSIEFVYESEDWDRSLNELATVRANTQFEPQVFDTDSQTQQVVDEYFDALDTLDATWVRNSFTDSVVQEMPFSPDWFPRTLRGDAVRVQYDSLPTMFESMNFERTYYPTQDPATIIVAYNGDIMTTDWTDYQNIYIGRFTVQDGRIATIIEYFDPTILWNAFWPDTLDPMTTTRKVQFQSGENTLVWNLYLPENFDESQQYPAIVVNGSWTSVKEQMPGLYAEQYAQEWYIALAFDHAGWGESEWEPRFVESPSLKSQNIIDATNYVRDLSYVNSDQVYGVWICASAWYVSDAWIDGANFTRIALIAPWLHNQELVESLYGWEEGVNDLIQTWRDAVQAYEQTWENRTIPGASSENPSGALMADFDYYANPERGLISEYDNEFSLTSREGWLTYDPVSRGPQVTTPTILIHSDSAAVPDGARQYASQLQSDNKLIMLWSATQDDFYDNMDYIRMAVKESLGWFWASHK